MPSPHPSPKSTPKSSPRPSPKPSPRPSPATLHRNSSPRSPSKPTTIPASKSADLQRLIHHYISSKRSLQSTAYVLRAHELVAGARPALERIAVLRARNLFVRRRVDGAVGRLGVFAKGLEGVGREVEDEFKVLLQTLDAVDVRVKRATELLKSTMVDALFKSRGEMKAEQGTQQTLHDFLDEKRLSEITALLHACIDSANEAIDNFTESHEELQTRVNRIQTVVRDPATDPRTDEATDKAHYEAEPETQVVVSFHTLESHATEMASLLQSLVRNYDLCITALKHTEGGSAAALQAQVSLGDMGASEHFEPIHQPMSSAERAELLDVLEKDADMVDDVVLEIRDRAGDMESTAEKIHARVSEREDEGSRLDSAVANLRDLHAGLEAYIAHGDTLMERWAEIRNRINEAMAELEGICEFYDGFLGAYASLLREVKRRDALRGKMDKVAHDANAKIEKLWQEDLAERERFREDQGEFLPLDLWPGMTDLPDRFEVRRVCQPVEGSRLDDGGDGVVGGASLERYETAIEDEHVDLS